MSRSNNTEIKNPAQRFFKWSGSDGKITYYDKEAKHNFDVGLPFTFLVLDRLVTMAGYSDADKSGIWSNEIRNTKEERLTVRTAKGIIAEGFYEQVKGKDGAKFAQSVYVAFINEKTKETELGNLKLTGCAVSAWIEFSKGRDVYQGAIVISGATEDKKGATKFFSPVFEQIPVVNQKVNDEATALDRKLQEYLKSYFALRGQSNDRSPIEQDTEEDYLTERDRLLADDDFPEWSGSEPAEEDPFSLTDPPKTEEAIGRDLTAEVKRNGDGFIVMQSNIARNAAGRVVCDCGHYQAGFAHDVNFRCRHIYAVKFHLERQQKQAA